MSDGGGGAVGGCCGSLACLLLIAGGIMFGICADAVESGVCGGHEEYKNAGVIMMAVGGGLLGLECLVCWCLVMCVACLHYADKEERGGAARAPGTTTAGRYFQGITTV